MIKNTMSEEDWSWLRLVLQHSDAKQVATVEVDGQPWAIGTDNYRIHAVKIPDYIPGAWSPKGRKASGDTPSWVGTAKKYMTSKPNGSLIHLPENLWWHVAIAPPEAHLLVRLTSLSWVLQEDNTTATHLHSPKFTRSSSHEGLLFDARFLTEAGAVSFRMSKAGQPLSLAHLNIPSAFRAAWLMPVAPATWKEKEES